MSSGPPESDRPEELPALEYESNPKHSEPWQIGKRGSICDNEVRPHAAELLRESVLWEGKRYAVFEERPYCAQEHLPGRWHGYPVGWVEVPAKLALQWQREGRVSKRNRRKYWEKH
ncbi:MAG: hypothetical protein ACOC8H_01875 [bacterium]